MPITSPEPRYRRLGHQEPAPDDPCQPSTLLPTSPNVSPGYSVHHNALFRVLLTDPGLIVRGVKLPKEATKFKSVHVAY